MCCKIPIIKGRTKKDLLIQKEKIENIDRSGSQYSQHATPKLHKSGLGGRRSPHCSTALTQDLATAIGSWGRIRNADVQFLREESH